MGTHPIFESDFDCLTDMIRFCSRFRSYNHRPPGKNSAKKKGKVIKGAMYTSGAEALEGTPHFLLRQNRDPYVKMAKIQNYRCRSAFKEPVYKIKTYRMPTKIYHF